MRYKLFLTGVILFFSLILFAESPSILRKKKNIATKKDSISAGINFIKELINAPDIWQFSKPEFNRNLKGLVHFIEDDKIDTILMRLNALPKQDTIALVTRFPWNVSDTLGIAGFLSNDEIVEKMIQLDRSVWANADLESISIPESLLSGLDLKIACIPKRDTVAIMARTGVVLPDSLKYISLNMGGRSKLTIQETERYNMLDSIRNQLLEEARVLYNDSLLKAYIESVTLDYRKGVVAAYSDSIQNQLKDSLKLSNAWKLVAYNDSVIQLVNDSIRYYVDVLKRHARHDLTGIWIHNTSGDSILIWTGNQHRSGNRMFIKNEQNDSIGVKFLNVDRNVLRIAIDDGVLISRIKAKKQRDIHFEQFIPEKDMHKIQQRYKVITPWKYGGNGNFGFTQTHLSNWQKGGESALSFLMVMRGFANYSQDKIKWENSAEIRNGWIRQGGDIKETRKNDDKFEITSRFGLSAFKKWYYSAEVDFETQFFNGYDYSDVTRTPISSFLAPAKTLIKLGLDYKPNSSFSLFLSPLTSKTVYVRDTARIDQTRYGVESDKKRYWKPGVNADVKYKMNLTSDISLETKYKMFVNYADFSKFDIDWETLVDASLTDRINVSFNIHFIYDSNVTNPKLQTRELMTVGFNYKINRRIYKRLKMEY